MNCGCIVQIYNLLLEFMKDFFKTNTVINGNCKTYLTDI